MIHFKTGNSWSSFEGGLEQSSHARGLLADNDTEDPSLAVEAAFHEALKTGNRLDYTEFSELYEGKIKKDWTVKNLWGLRRFIQACGRELWGSIDQDVLGEWTQGDLGSHLDQGDVAAVVRNQSRAQIKFKEIQKTYLSDKRFSLADYESLWPQIVGEGQTEYFIGGFAALAMALGEIASRRAEGFQMDQSLKDRLVAEKILDRIDPALLGGLQLYSHFQEEAEGALAEAEALLLEVERVEADWTRVDALTVGMRRVKKVIALFEELLFNPQAAQSITGPVLDQMMTVLRGSYKAAGELCDELWHFDRSVGYYQAAIRMGRRQGSPDERDLLSALIRSYRNRLEQIQDGTTRATLKQVALAQVEELLQSSSISGVDDFRETDVAPLKNFPVPLNPEAQTICRGLAEDNPALALAAQWRQPGGLIDQVLFQYSKGLKGISGAILVKISLPSHVSLESSAPALELSEDQTNPLLGLEEASRQDLLRQMKSALQDSPAFKELQGPRKGSLAQASSCSYVFSISIQKENPWPDLSELSVRGRLDRLKDWAQDLEAQASSPGGLMPAINGTRRLVSYLEASLQDEDFSQHRERTLGLLFKALYRLGTLYSNLNEYALASENLKKAIDLDGSDFIERKDRNASKRDYLEARINQIIRTLPPEAQEDAREQLIREAEAFLAEAARGWDHHDLLELFIEKMEGLGSQRVDGSGPRHYYPTAKPPQDLACDKLAPELNSLVTFLLRRSSLRRTHFNLSELMERDRIEGSLNLRINLPEAPDLIHFVSVTREPGLSEAWTGRAEALIQSLGRVKFEGGEGEVLGQWELMNNKGLLDEMTLAGLSGTNFPLGLAGLESPCAINLTIPFVSEESEALSVEETVSADFRARLLTDAYLSFDEYLDWMRGAVKGHWAEGGEQSLKKSFEGVLARGEAKNLDPRIIKHLSRKDMEGFIESETLQRLQSAHGLK